uniref:Uncharacterized protein n=1 Tax=Glossina pallidipes TaxID=7398 RepID=A0A1A9Z506_GLOPL
MCRIHPIIDERMKVWKLRRVDDTARAGTSYNEHTLSYITQLLTNTMAPTICSGKKQPSRTLRNDIRRQYRNNSSNAVPSSVFNYINHMLPKPKK